jgi:hypothetical protein
MYVGYTAREKEQEDLRWLTTRGADLAPGVKYMGKRNRPVIRYADHTIVRMDQARTDFHFKSIVVYSSPCQLNALDVEAKIQRLLHELPLGIRLWYYHTQMYY